jgi:hypothetical protein
MRFKKHVVTTGYGGLFCLCLRNGWLPGHEIRRIDGKLAQANCTMEEPEEAPVGKMYSCEDFTFASNKTEATLFFVNDKFIRIAIAIPDDDVAKTLETLKQQYGVAAHSSQKRCRTWICIPIKRRSLISITIISRCSGPAMKMRRAARR